jgi:outer membrane protein assembly factor BamB
MKPRGTLIAIMVTLAVAGAVAADWPWIYGPNRNSTSDQKRLLRTWPKEGPRVLWTAPVGVGFGGPAISGGKVYLLDRDEKVGDKLRCFDLATGKELWSYSYDAPGRFMFSGSRTTPTVDGDKVYTCGPLGDLYCISATTHRPLWQKNIWRDFGGGGDVPAFREPPSGFGAPGSRPPAPPAGQPGAPGSGGAPGGTPPGPPGGRQGASGGAVAPGSVLPTWGIVQNPLIHGNLVIVAAQTPQAGVVAYDKVTGELKWKTAPLSGNPGYVSPSIVKVSGEDHVVMATASVGRGRNASGGSVNGIDPLSGKILWTYSNWQCAIPVPHAVDAGDGRVLISGGYSAGTAMIKVQKATDGTYSVAELFKNPDFGSHTQPPVLFKDHFYSHYTINERSDGLVCMTMAGQVTWKTGEDPAFVRGGSVLADGLLLTTDGNTMLYLVEPDPSGFKPLASAVMLEPGTNWAPLALVDGKLFIRDQKQLKCVQVAQ